MSTRLNTEWLEKCAQAGEFLYGVYPAEVLLDLYETRDAADFTIQEMVQAAVSSPAIMMEYVDELLPVFESMGYDKAGYFRPLVADSSQPELLDMFRKAEEAGNPYASLHTDPEEWSFLLKDQGDVTFYIPDDDEEIIRVATEMYIESDEMKAYVSLFDNPDEGMDFAKQAWQKISAGVIDKDTDVVAPCNKVHRCKKLWNSGRQVFPLFRILALIQLSGAPNELGSS